MERSKCSNCYHHKEGMCQLFDVKCVNSEYKPSFLTQEEVDAHRREDARKEVTSVRENTAKESLLDLKRAWQQVQW